MPAVLDGSDYLPDGVEIDPDALAPAEDRSPEIRLFRAVVCQCWSDAFVAPDAWICSSSGGAPRTAESKAEKAGFIRAEARRWLTADYGDDRADRQEICEAANLDPDRLRQAALRRIAAEKAGEVERPGANRVAATTPSAEVVSLDDMFERLLRQEANLSSDDLDSALAELASLESAA